jgi:hypothetical protein
MLKKIHKRQATAGRRYWSHLIPEVLWKLCDALGEAKAAHRQYDWLRSRGIPHDHALKEALSSGHSAYECHALNQHRRESATITGHLASRIIGLLLYVK